MPATTTSITPLADKLPIAGLQVRGLRAGQGEPLLLLHGWPEWSHAWRPVMARLAPHFDLVAPDLRGFGDTLPASTTPSRDAGPERHAEDLLELADRLGLQRFGLVAHDVGSFVGQALARRAPQRLSGLFFFNCAYPGIGRRWVEPRHLQEIWYQFFHQQPWAAELVGSSREACRIYLRHFLGHWSHERSWIEQALEDWVEQFLKPGRLQGGFNWYASVHEARMAVIEGQLSEAASSAAPIAVPTRVLWGAHDPVLKAAWSDRLHEHFSNLQLDIQPDAGHFVHLEQPDAAAAAIGAFFCGLAR
jgi:pimeloyl-ACP methyl ester carboxylesterase